MGLKEVVIVSCTDHQGPTIRLFEPQTGTLLKGYSGAGEVGAHNLASQGGLLIAGERGKGRLRAWALNKQHPEPTRLTCPGKIACAALSPSAHFLAVAMEERLHLYQLSSGKLLGVGTYHFQPLTTLLFSSDGCALFSGGEDGVVAAWLLSSLASKENNGPWQVFSEHTLPVTDLAATQGTTKARVASVSIDRTCKIYDLFQSEVLASFVFEEALTSVAFFSAETHLFIGDTEGSVVVVPLHSPPRNFESHIGSGGQRFVGHTKAVKALSVSTDGSLLVSGSLDGTLRLWDITSGQCVRNINLRGSISNAFFSLVPSNSFDKDFKPEAILRDLIPTGENGAQDESFDVMTTTDLFPPVKYNPPLSIAPQTQGESDVDTDELFRINQQLYMFSVRKLLNQTEQEPLPYVPLAELKEFRNSALQSKNKDKSPFVDKGTTDKKKRKEKPCSSNGSWTVS